MFVGLDPERTRALAQTMDAAGVAAEDLAADVDVALRLSALTSPVAERLRVEATDLDRVGVVLVARADLADGFEIDVSTLAADLGISTDAAAEAIAALRDPDADPDANPLLDSVAAGRFLTGSAPRSARDMVSTLPPPGEDPELDAALERFDGELLTAYLDGRPPSATDLTARQQQDMLIISAALGGDEITVRRERTEKYSGAKGDDEYRRVTEDIPITGLGAEANSNFVMFNLVTGGGLTQTGGTTGGDPFARDDPFVRDDDPFARDDPFVRDDDPFARDDPFVRDDDPFAGDGGAVRDGGGSVRDGGGSVGAVDKEFDRIQDAIGFSDDFGFGFDAKTGRFEAKDLTNGRSFEGVYRETETGYQVKGTFRGVSGVEGNITFSNDGQTTKRATSIPGVFGATSVTDLTTGQTEFRSYPATPPDQIGGTRHEGGQNNGGFDPTDVDNDGITDTEDPHDDSGDPTPGASGGGDAFDGAI